MSLHREVECWELRLKQKKVKLSNTIAERSKFPKSKCLVPPIIISRIKKHVESISTCKDHLKTLYDNIEREELRKYKILHPSPLRGKIFKLKFEALYDV